MVAAVGAALAYGQRFDSITIAIPHHHAPVGRMNVLTGIDGSILIDDSYNASPDAVREALAVLCDVNPSSSDMSSVGLPVRKIAILGDMMELGAFSLEEHKKIGEIAAHALMSLSAPVENLLVTVGIRARDIALSAIAAGMPKEAIHSFDSSAAAAEYIKTIIGKTGGTNGQGNMRNTCDVILIKGSQSPRMERVTRVLLAGPDGKSASAELAAKLLVRQETEWLAIA